MDRLFQLLQAGIESTEGRKEEFGQLPLFGSPYVTPKTFGFLSACIDFLLAYGTNGPVVLFGPTLPLSSPSFGPVLPEALLVRFLLMMPSI